MHERLNPDGDKPSATMYAGMQQLVDARMVCFYDVVEETPLARLNTMSWLMSHQ
ncbi:hypothetical protein HanXRQr2_Chr03g0108631 [Helianthus annuus]|uniref:Uncharacterized protein n=1 Tax=Helianthus annuus TaxID=4232 RepID=A0A9K3NWN3_HELAN|nr:hypothetical protein HanXRQr2_Chr03g0108631 [Helianthus annuus]